MGSNDNVSQPPIEQDLSSRLQEYKGRWVAVDLDKVVAVGDSVAEVIKSARDGGYTDPLVFKVSASPDRLAFF